MIIWGNSTPRGFAPLPGCSMCSMFKRLLIFFLLSIKFFFHLNKIELFSRIRTLEVKAYHLAIEMKTITFRLWEKTMIRRRSHDVARLVYAVFMFLNGRHSNHSSINRSHPIPLANSRCTNANKIPRNKAKQQQKGIENIEKCWAKDRLRKPRTRIKSSPSMHFVKKKKRTSFHKQ